jgi:hypothetical protein
MWLLKLLRFITLLIAFASLMGMFQNWQLSENPLNAKTQMISYFLNTPTAPSLDSLEGAFYAFHPYTEHDTLFQAGQEVFEIKTQTFNEKETSKAIITLSVDTINGGSGKAILEWSPANYLKWEKELTRICEAKFMGVLGSHQNLYFEAVLCNEDSSFCQKYYLITNKAGKKVGAGLAGDLAFAEKINAKRDLLLTSSALIHLHSGVLMEFNASEPLLAAWLNDSVFTIVYEPVAFPNAYLFNINGDTIFSFLLEGQKEPVHFIQNKEIGVHLYFLPLLNEVILFQDQSLINPLHYNLNKISANNKKEKVVYKLDYQDSFGINYSFGLNSHYKLIQYQVRNNSVVQTQDGL